ncbi:MAG: stage II sporulation protein M [Candidatus Bathyarchaeota archaeon]|nr:stage II sporulation protein M [Candidatus Bathyarchaeota archaeon]
MFNWSFWKNASPKMKRFYSILFIFVVAVLMVAIGSAVPLSSQDAQLLSNQLNQTLNENRATNTLTQYIFLNNFGICMLMFVPIIGPALGMFILFDTGLALGAISTTQGYPVYIGWLSLVVTPVFWLEFVAYSIAMAESIWLFRRLTQGRWRELKWTGIFVGICAALLIVGAIVEVWIINFAGSL